MRVYESAFLRVVSTSNAVPAKFYVGLRRNSKCSTVEARRSKIVGSKWEIKVQEARCLVLEISVNEKL